MLKVLLKKQLMEVFKGYFYDAKKNKKRSKLQIILYFGLYIVLMFGVIGSMFTMLALSMCEVFSEAGYGWLYFVIMNAIAIVFGAFGSIFSTYAGLYLAKDNDLLLSMPIEIKYIIISRLLNVYLMGALYSATVLLPTIIIYFIFNKITLTNVLGALTLIIVVSFIVLSLSCLLGFGVAKISSKLKNKSIITTLISLLFIGAYYLFYFKAQTLLQDLIINVMVYGEKIKGAAYGLYIFGKVGEGDLVSIGICLLVTVLIVGITFFILRSTFTSITTTNNGASKVKYKEKSVKVKSSLSALISKEFLKFTSNSNFMLNSGLGLIMIPAMGVFLLIKGDEYLYILEQAFGNINSIIIIFIAVILSIASMNDMAAPSVSLEGKNIWIVQSLPVNSKQVLDAKILMQLILTTLPILFTTICGLIVAKIDISMAIIIVLLAMIINIFIAVFDCFLGITMVNIHYTNEIVPIKQSGAIVIAIFGVWAIDAIFAVIYFLVLPKSFNINLYLIIWAFVFTLATLVLYRYISTKGAKKFAHLQ